MEKITEQALQQLIGAPQSKAVVTIYTPIHSSAAPPHKTEDAIRLKNLVHQAMRHLKEQQGTEQLVTALQGWLETAISQTVRPDQHVRSLLLCAYDSIVRTYQLPIDTEEYVAVDTVFHLAPIVGLLNDVQEFYLLAVSQNHPCLFKGDLYGLSPAGIQLPESPTAALHLDENNQKSEQALSAGGSSMRTNAFNGRGGARDPREDDHLRFLRLIDKAVTDKADRSLPLILAGTESEVAAYRGISKHTHLLQRAIYDNVAFEPRETAFAQAKHIIEQEVIEPRHEEAIATLARLQATAAGRVTDTPTGLQSAAAEGRIATLFIGMNSYTADTIQDDVAPQQRLTFPKAAVKQLIHAVALAVHHTKGRVVMLDQQTIPGGIPAAAVLRY
jgi:hypothetical protein